jgi:hypothetical protein
MAEEVKKEAYEFSIAGFKLKLNSTLLAVAIPIVTTVGGALWGGFEVYNTYRIMQKKVEAYEAPDLSGIEKRLAIVEENSTKAVDYTRDIKNDLKADIRNLEKVVENVERTSKQSQRETEQDVRQLRKDIDSKIQKAMDNPLANK